MVRFHTGRAGCGPMFVSYSLEACWNKLMHTLFITMLLVPEFTPSLITNRIQKAPKQTKPLSRHFASSAVELLSRSSWLAPANLLSVEASTLLSPARLWSPQTPGMPVGSAPAG
jgi:hypothetical protein